MKIFKKIQRRSAMALLFLALVQPCLALEEPEPRAVLPEGLRNPRTASAPDRLEPARPKWDQQLDLDIQKIDTTPDFFAGLLIPPAIGFAGAFAGSRLDGMGNPHAGDGVQGTILGYLVGAIGGTILICDLVEEPKPDLAKTAGLSKNDQAAYLAEFKKQGKYRKHHEALTAGILGDLIVPLAVGAVLIGSSLNTGSWW